MALIDKLKAIADGFRSARGTADPLTLDEMAVLASEPAGMDEAQLDGIAEKVNELNGSENVAIIQDGSGITFGNQNGLPVERNEAYSISSDDLNALGAITQTMAGKHTLMTVSDMIQYLGTVQFIPRGNAESSFSLSFDSGASGILPDVQIGTATSAFSLNFTASAVRELQEG